MVVEAIGHLRELLLHRNHETTGKHPHSPLKSLSMHLGVKGGNPSCHKELLKIYPRDRNGFMQNANQGRF